MITDRTKDQELTRSFRRHFVYVDLHLLWLLVVVQMRIHVCIERVRRWSMELTESYATTQQNIFALVERRVLTLNDRLQEAASVALLLRHDFEKMQFRLKRE